MGFFYCRSNLIKNEFMFSPTVVAVLITVGAGLAFTGGFAISNWRSALHLQRLSFENAALSESKKKCATDIQSVQDAMHSMTETAAKREKIVAKAIKGAASTAARHTNRAKKTHDLPSVAPERQYEVILKEQAEYVRSRHQQD